MEASEILDVRSTAEVLKCSESHVLNLINGKVAGVPLLPSLRVGRRRLLRRSTLMKWIADLECACGMLSCDPSRISPCENRS